MIYLLSVREGGDGAQVVPAFLIEDSELGTLDDFRQETTLTFLIHGFNVSGENGRDSLLQMARIVEPSIKGALVATLWPGDHWLGPLSYSFEGTDADDSAFQLTRFITDHIQAESTLNFVAHSLGCRVIMETISRLTHADLHIGQLCLMAAAIDSDSLANPLLYHDEALESKRLAVLYSKEDEVLKYAYPAGDLLQAFIFWKTDEAGGALGYHGPKRHRPSRTRVPGKVFRERIPSARGADHSDYLPAQNMTAEQHSAVKFATAVINGANDPQYR